MAEPDAESERGLAAAQVRIAELQACIAELQEEIEQLRAKAKVAICLWCNARVEKTVEAIGVHWESCPSHPMRALEREVRRLRALVGIERGE